MAARKASIYVSPPINAALEALGETDNLSGRLATVCERYLAMVADELSRLKLTRNEWCAVLDANNGVQQFIGDPFSATLLWANVHDTPGLGEKWDVDQAELVRRLQDMPKSTLTSIKEVCDRFWSRSQMDTDEALAAAGVRIAGEAEPSRA